MHSLLSIMKQLRDPESGCPWDQQQTFASIAPYTLEEAYEVVDAIQRRNWDELQDELGDLLFQVVFHAQMAAETGKFDFEDVVGGIVDKMRRRHPHVFGDDQIDNAQQQTQAWEQHKEAERRQKQQAENSDVPGILDGVPVALPALTRAVKLQKRAARAGFDWTELEPIFDKIIEELEEVKAEIASNAEKELIEGEIGDLFFAVSNLARHLDIDPERATRLSNAKFESRFRGMEQLARQQHQSPHDLSLDELEALYQQVKRQEP
ncbi:MAG: nucleoside triphosphate pyrophosphohydrolase [Gammaproteobacteria bacterium]